jgi:hypothetical protein
MEQRDFFDDTDIDKVLRAREILLDGEAHKRVFYVRHTTNTRDAIYITVLQRYTMDGRLALPTITISGTVPAHLESYQFVIDFAERFLLAGLEAREWAKKVDRT